MERLGIDFGGSGIKGNTVELSTGEPTRERYKILTPQPSTPDAVAEVIAQIVGHFSWTEAIGCTCPAVVKDGVVLTAANIDKGWIGADADALFEKRLGLPFHMLNDADAAGIAEMRFGAGRDRRGVVVIVTLGTGIGTAVFVDGVLVPNTELGHIEVDGKDAEVKAAAAVRETAGISWQKWARQVDRYLEVLENLLWPDLIIVGGGVSRKADKWLPFIDRRAEVVAAALQNEAGIVGAALAVAER